MSAGPFATAVHALASPEEVEAFLKDTLGNRIEALEAAVIDCLSSLVAAVSLLERGGKRAAPSNKMFAQMLIDYNRAIERTRGSITQASTKLRG